MKTTALQKKNRETILRFLRTEMPASRFDLSELQHGELAPDSVVPSLAKFDCKTVGCVIGWSPEIFPQEAKFIIQYGGFLVQSIKTGSIKFWEIGEELYGVHPEDAQILFNSRGNYERHEEVVIDHECFSDSPPTQVADRLEAYFNAHP